MSAQASAAAAAAAAQRPGPYHLAVHTVCARVGSTGRATRGMLPRLAAGVRRRWLAGLVGIGLGQAALGGLGAWALIRMQSAGAASTLVFGLSVAVLVLSALGVGTLKIHERTVAERLGQDYVHQLRLRLLGSALSPGERTSLGVTVARTTNDLSSVKNWVSQGIAPALVGVPLILGTSVILLVLHWQLALGFIIPVAVLGVLLVWFKQPMFERTRTLRRTRGRLAARIAETVTAAETIIADGGRDRELKRITSQSAQLAEHAVTRAETVGALRAAGAVTGLLASLLVAAIGIATAASPGTVMAAMALTGIATSPILDLGRIIEYRQTFLAARRIIGPALSAADERSAQAATRRAASAELTCPLPAAAAGSVVLSAPGLLEQPLTAAPGEVVWLADDSGRASALMRRIAGLDSSGHTLSAGRAAESAQPDAFWADGQNLLSLSPTTRRRLVGWARAGTVFERGRLDRALHYRRPDLDGQFDAATLDRVGLDVDALPKGARTMLRAGGQPLSRSERARLALARAVYADPPLLLIDGLDGDLGAAGTAMLTSVLADYPGVVLFTGSPAVAEAVGARTVDLTAAG